jgi:hypothetical protein
MFDASPTHHYHFRNDVLFWYVRSRLDLHGYGMILRCKVVDVWHIAYQTEDKGKIAPVKEEVVAFQNIDIRDVPPFWQIMPCLYCGSETDRHDPIKHINTHLL